MQHSLNFGEIFVTIKATFNVKFLDINLRYKDTIHFVIGIIWLLIVCVGNNTFYG